MNSASYGGGKWLNKNVFYASMEQELKQAVLHAYGLDLCPVVTKNI